MQRLRAAGGIERLIDFLLMSLFTGLRLVFHLFRKQLVFQFFWGNNEFVPSIELRFSACLAA